MTIVGVEEDIDGSIHLLVFDPSRDDAAEVTRLVGKTIDTFHSHEVLSPYRRGHRYLGRFREFETLR